LHVEPDAHRIEHRLVDYDHASVLDAIERVRHPASDYLKRFYEPKR